MKLHISAWLALACWFFKSPFWMFLISPVSFSLICCLVLEFSRHKNTRSLFKRIIKFNENFEGVVETGIFLTFLSGIVYEYGDLSFWVATAFFIAHLLYPSIWSACFTIAGMYANTRK